MTKRGTRRVMYREMGPVGRSGALEKGSVDGENCGVFSMMCTIPKNDDEVHQLIRHEEQSACGLRCVSWGEARKEDKAINQSIDVKEMLSLNLLDKCNNLCPETILLISNESSCNPTSFEVSLQEILEVLKQNEVKEASNAQNHGDEMIKKLNAELSELSTQLSNCMKEKKRLANHVDLLLKEHDRKIGSFEKIKIDEQSPSLSETCSRAPQHSIRCPSPCKKRNIGDLNSLGHRGIIPQVDSFLSTLTKQSSFGSIGEGRFSLTSSFSDKPAIGEAFDVKSSTILPMDSWSGFQLNIGCETPSFPGEDVISLAEPLPTKLQTLRPKAPSFSSIVSQGCTSVPPGFGLTKSI